MTSVRQRGRRRSRRSPSRLRCRRRRPPEETTRLTYVSLDGNGTRTVFRYLFSNAVLDFDAEDREDWLRCGTGAILADGEVVEETEVPLRPGTEISDQRDEPIAVVIVAPEGKKLSGFRTPPPDKSKVHDGRIAYYWFPPGEPLSADQRDGPYRQRIVWERLVDCSDLDAEVTRLESLGGERYAVDPSDGLGTDGVYYPDEVVATIVSAHYPRHLSAVDRERSQAQLALGGITSLVAIGFAAVGLSQQSSSPSVFGSVTLALAVVAWLATAVIGSLAFMSPATVKRPPPTLHRNEFVDHILAVARSEAGRAAQRLKWALGASVLAIVMTGVAVVALAFDSTEIGLEQFEGIVYLKPGGEWLPPPGCPVETLTGLVALPAAGGDFVEMDVVCGGTERSVIIPLDAVGGIVRR